MIGYSLETDILPAQEVGLNVIYVTNSDIGNQFRKINNIEALYERLLVENNLK